MSTNYKCQMLYIDMVGDTYHDMLNWSFSGKLYFLFIEYRILKIVDNYVIGNYQLSQREREKERKVLFMGFDLCIEAMTC